MNTLVRYLPYLTAWDFTNANKKESELLGMKGFTYCITFPDGKYYIGKKEFGTKARKIAEGAKWQNYISSSEVVHAKVAAMFAANPASLKDIKREVIDVVGAKINLTYAEAARLFQCNALTDNDCLNENIMGKFFRRKPGTTRGCPVTISI